MNRAARRRAERDAKKLGTQVTDGKPQFIKLQNPVDQFFESFIFANALHCEYVVEPDTCEGKTVVICGAGPSLAEEAEEWCNAGDELWGCNSALTWLLERGYPVTRAITVDQTPAMVIEWATAPDVEYLLASTVHPHLTEHLLSRERRLRWFHNFVGIKKPPVSWCECGHDHDVEDWNGGTRYKPECAECECTEYRPKILSYEDWLYVTLFPPTIRTGSGLNTCTRAVDLALSMGFEKVIVLGADCQMRVKRRLPEGTHAGSAEHKRWLEEDTVMHADGGNALRSGATPVTLGAEIDGEWVETKPDMAISAMFMLKMQEVFGEDRLVYVGDTLPNKLKRAKSFRTKTGELVTENVQAEFQKRLPQLMDADGNPMPITILPAPLLTDSPQAT